MKAVILLFLSSFYAGFVASQSLSACALACVSQAATADGCGSFDNSTCVCTSAQFQQDARSCLMAECTMSDLTTLEGLQASVCGSSGLSATGAPTSTGTFIATGISSGTGTSLIPSTSSGAASTTASGASGASGSSVSGSAPTSNTAGGSTTAASSGSSPAPTSGDKRIEIPLGMIFGIGVTLMAGLLG